VKAGLDAVRLQADLRQEGTADDAGVYAFRSSQARAFSSHVPDLGLAFVRRSNGST